MDTHPLWQKLAGLRPSLPRHIDIQRRDYNHERWYLLQDKSNGRFHRLTPSAYRLLSFMNGRNTLQQIVDAASAQDLYESPDDIPSVADVIHLVQYLHVADLLVCDMPPNTQELFNRKQKLKKQQWLRLLTNPVAWKFSLGNPDKILTALLPLGNLLATPIMGIVWLLVVGYALLQMGNHWHELTHGQLDKILSPSNLFLLWLIYPLLKIVHETGHGLFTKVWGGHVHECGVMVILGTPLPYVDASAATGFSSKNKRLMVSAAGMAVELFLAAIALLVWIDMSPSIGRDILYNVMLIGGVSTLFFNGNPLMRYDGYYLLTDAFDLPNLYSRANQQISYLVRHYGYGLQGLVSPAANPSQAIFFVGYGLAAWVYRLSMLLVIIVFVANYFPTLGLLLGIWLVSIQLLWPTIKYVHFLVQGSPLKEHRRRALSLAGGALAVLLIGLIAIPLPYSTAVEGVVWMSDKAHIKSETTGEITEVLVADGTLVQAGQPLMRLTNIALTAELAFKKAHLREYEMRLQGVWNEDRNRARLLEEDIQAIKAELQHIQAKVDHLTIICPSTGRFRSNKQYELLGAYLQQGEDIGIIETDEPFRIRAALTQAEVGLVRQQTRAVEVRLASQLGDALSAQISQEVPAGTFDLPSVILGAAGGGRLPIDATKPDGIKTTQMVFLMDVSLQTAPAQGRFGERAYVRFYHPPLPAGFQLYRSLQELFIRTFKQ